MRKGTRIRILLGVELVGQVRWKWKSLHAARLHYHKTARSLLPPKLGICILLLLLLLRTTKRSQESFQHRYILSKHSNWIMQLPRITTMPIAFLSVADFSSTDSSST